MSIFYTVLIEDIAAVVSGFRFTFDCHGRVVRFSDL